MRKRIIALLLAVFLAPMLPAQAPALVLTLPAGTNDAACSATVARACMKEFVVKVGGVEKGRIAYAQGTLAYPIPSAMLGALSPGAAIAVDVVFLDEYGAAKQQAYKTITVPASYLPSFLSGGSLAWGQSTTAGGTVNGGTLGTGADVTAPTITPNPPTISNGIGSITTTSAIITVTTNELAVCRLRYGTSSGVYGTTLAYESTQATSHPLVIGSSPALSANTHYFGVVDCKDAVPNTSTSSEWDFTTQAAAASDPLYGSSSTGALVPAKKYLMEVASYSGSGAAMTVTVTGTFDPTGLNNGEKLKVCLATDCSGYMTPSGSVDSVASTPTSTSFTFSSSSTASGTGGWVLFMPVWNDGDVWTASPGSTPVRRLCNREGLQAYRIFYSAPYGVSPDGTMVLVGEIGSGKVGVLNISNCTFVRTPTEMSTVLLQNEDDNARWIGKGTANCPGTNDCLIWFKYNSGQVRTYDPVAGGGSSTLHDTIAGCGSGLSLDRTGDLDVTYDLVAIRCNTGSGYHYFVYVISTLTKRTPYATASGAADFTQVLDNGNFVVVWQATGSGNEQGIQYYNGSTGARIQQVATVSPHGTVRNFSDGKPWFIGYDGGNTMCGVSSLFARDVINLVTTCLETGGNPGTDRTLGITSAGGAHPDFILYSYQGPGGYPITVQGNAWQANWTKVYQAEVGLIKWPGTGSIANFRLAHHWQRTLDNGSGGYNNLPHATMNRSGTVIVFNSWDVCGSTPTACVPKGTVGSNSYPMGFGVMKPFDSGNP